MADTDNPVRDSLLRLGIEAERMGLPHIASSWSEGVPAFSSSGGHSAGTGQDYRTAAMNRSSLSTLALMTSTALALAAAEPAWQPLWDKAPGPALQEQADQSRDNGEHISRIVRPEIQVFAPDAAKPAAARPALVVLPGGGYGILAVRKEGSEIAQWAAAQGMVGVVVKYRVTDRAGDGYQFPVPLMDARRAIRTVRHRAAEWGVDPNRIGIIGFSAGGHLAAMATTLWNEPLEGETGDAIDKVSARPDFGVLVYPVIAIDQPYGHVGSRKNLLGENPDPALVARCCPARKLAKDTPPLCLIHAADDPVSCLNSFDMARAAKEHGVPLAFHLFENGGHGFGLRKQGKAADAWPEAVAAWMANRKILP